MENTYSSIPRPSRRGPRVEVKDVPLARSTRPLHTKSLRSRCDLTEPMFGAGLTENWYVRMLGKSWSFTPEENPQGLERKEFLPDSPMSSSPEVRGRGSTDTHSSRPKAA